MVKTNIISTSSVDVTLLCTKFYFGMPNDPANPVRILENYSLPDGTLLFTVDPFKPTPAGADIEKGEDTISPPIDTSNDESIDTLPSSTPEV